MFAGSATSTPTLQAILDALGSQDAAVGYSVTYPFGVAGPILCLYAYHAIFKPAIAAPVDQRIQPAEVRVRNPLLVGRPFGDLQQRLPAGIQVAAIRSGEHNRVPSASTVLAADDVMLIIGTDPAKVDHARLIGEPTARAADRSASITSASTHPGQRRRMPSAASRSRASITATFRCAGVTSIPL